MRRQHARYVTGGRECAQAAVMVKEFPLLFYYLTPELSSSPIITPFFYLLPFSLFSLAQRRSHDSKERQPGKQMEWQGLIVGEEGKED